MQLGSGGGTGYPGTIDTIQTFVNGPTPAPDSNTRFDAELINDLLQAMLAVQMEMGVDVAGTFATVVARLNDFNARLVVLDNGGVVLSQRTTQAVVTIDDAIQLTTTGLVTPGGSLTQLMAYVDIQPGSSRGLASWSLGTPSATQRFGRGKLLTVGTKTVASDVVGYEVEPAPSGLEAVITAPIGTPFDSVGRFIVTAVYELYVVPQAVP